MKDSERDWRDINRKLAYESLAVFCGLSEYIPHTDYCILRTETKELLGSFQVPSRGVTQIARLSSKDRIEMITPSFQMAISKMRLFDTICHELDHSLNNYHPVMDSKGKFVSVSMFDNGSAGTFGATLSLSDKTYYGCDSLFSKEGHFTTPYQDESFVRIIQKICLFDLLHSLTCYVSYRSVLFTWIRLRKIKKIIKRDLACGFLNLLAVNQWSMETVNNELSGVYGNTYMYSFVHQWGGRWDITIGESTDNALLRMLGPEMIIEPSGLSSEINRVF